MSDASFTDPSAIRSVPRRQQETLSGNEEPIYALLENPMREPYSTDESQMMNLNQIDALNIPITTDVMIDDVDTNFLAQANADNMIPIPNTVVRFTNADETDSLGL